MSTKSDLDKFVVSALEETTGHTKGKVKIGLSGSVTPDWDRLTIFDDQDNFFADTETSTKTYEEEAANARRIVACWNLLLPFTTEEIETGIDLVKLMQERDELRKDAERYRWLRAQHWNEAEIAVVCHPKMTVRLGFDCPSLQRLDEYIDAVLNRGES